MIVVDANILLYAYDSDSPRHEAAKRWLEGTLGSEADVRFGLSTVLAFLRIGTDPRVYARPMSTADAISLVRSWLEHPNVSLALPTERHWPLLDEVAAAGKARGPLLMDAHLAALTAEHGATLATTDRDFKRFSGVKVIDPLAT